MVNPDYACIHPLEPLPNDKSLDRSILIAFAGNKMMITLKLKIFFGEIEKMLGKGENSDYLHFFHFLR